MLFPVKMRANSGKTVWCPKLADMTPAALYYNCISIRGAGRRWLYSLRRERESISANKSICGKSLKSAYSWVSEKSVGKKKVAITKAAAVSGQVSVIYCPCQMVMTLMKETIWAKTNYCKDSKLLTLVHKHKHTHWSLDTAKLGSNSATSKGDEGRNNRRQLKDIFLSKIGPIRGMGWKLIRTLCVKNAAMLKNARESP